MEKQEQEYLLRMEHTIELLKLCFYVLLCLALIGGGIFMAAYQEEYPSEQELSYEDCTFLRYEYKQGKNRYCLIYVAEYEQPLKISGTAAAKVNKNLLSAVSRGDSIRVSVDGPEDKQPYLFSVSYRTNDILSYEDWLASQRPDDQFRAWVGIAFIPLGIFILFLVIREYITTGKLPPVRSRFRKY